AFRFPPLRPNWSAPRSAVSPAPLKTPTSCFRDLSRPVCTFSERLAERRRLDLSWELILVTMRSDSLPELRPVANPFDHCAFTHFSPIRTRLRHSTSRLESAHCEYLKHMPLVKLSR